MGDPLHLADQLLQIATAGRLEVHAHSPAVDTEEQLRVFIDEGREAESLSYQFPGN